jgi:serine/threonine-protein kinase
VTKPALSPDGRFVAMGAQQGAAGFEVWVKQLDRGPASKLADVGLTPAWTPNGSDILFWSTGGLHVGPADGSVLPRLRYARQVRPSGFEYSPDGQWIVANVAGDLFAFRASGDTTTVPLVTGPRTDQRATISPDSRWMAYESEESGRLQVYVRPFPQVQTAKRQISVDGGWMSRWSADGRELFFLNDALDMIAVPVTLSPTFSSGIPQVLFNAGFSLPALGFAVSPDGKRFLMSRRVGGGVEVPDQLVVVQNYVEELKARLPQ